MNGSGAGDMVMGIVISLPLLICILMCAEDPDNEPGDKRIDMAAIQAFMKILAPIWVIVAFWIADLFEADLSRMPGSIPEQLMTVLYVGIVTLTLSATLVSNARRWRPVLWRTAFTMNSLFVFEIAGAGLFFYLLDRGIIPH